MLDWWKGRSSWVFWLALIVLVANDHWLKGSHLAPGWLTGKLSDFAGLIVAPVLLVSLIGARTARTRFACVAAVAIVFASLELFPAWVRTLEALDIGGHRMRMWPDPTDLLALAVLPFAWWIITRAPQRMPLRLGTPLIHRLGVALASLACVATSEFGDPPPLLPLILNQSHASITLTARRYLGLVNCSQLDGGSSEPRLDSAAPLASDFAAALTATIEPTRFMELGESPSPPSCAAYWITSAGLGNLIITFAQVPGYDDEDYNSLVLEGPPAELRAIANPGVWISDTPAPANEAP